jgi:adenylate cyclase
MADEGFKRKLAAILSADVEGYSRLMGDDEEATVRTLTTYRSAINDLVQQYRGRIVDSPGDNILAEFTSVVDAVNCAVEIQRDLAERNTNLPNNRKMEFRIGVNLGDVIEEQGRIYGDGVNIAARVESLAEAGGICISGRVYDQVANKLGLDYENLGEHQVKNISTPIRIYRVMMAANISEKFSIEEHAGLPLPDKPSIAVLPFNNMSGDSEQEYFSDGITEDIITTLSRSPWLFVIARNSSFAYRGTTVNVRQISRELGVRYILEGSVRRAGNRVREPTCGPKSMTVS